MTTALRQLQQDIQHYLMTAEQSAKSHVAGPDSDFINLRLSLYSDAYALRLVEFLATDFSVVKSMVGEEEFETIALAYIAKYPSTYPNARFFGSHFASFLKEQYKQQPELAKMANFEWALNQAEDAADLKLLTQLDLAAIPEQAWPELVFHLHPSVQFIELDYNIPAIWQAAQHENALPTLVKSSTQLWTIWRHELTAHFHQHNEEELAFLKAVVAQKNFTEICELLANGQNIEQSAELVVGHLLTFINNQMLVNVEITGQ